MRIDVVSIFPEYLAPLHLSLVGRAIADGLIDLDVHDLRDFTHDRHRTVDDSPYGGGPGMVMKPEPWGEALHHVLAAGDPGDPVRLVVPTPSGPALRARRALDRERPVSPHPRLATHDADLHGTHAAPASTSRAAGTPSAAASRCRSASRMISGRRSHRQIVDCGTPMRSPSCACVNPMYSLTCTSVFVFMPPIVATTARAVNRKMQRPHFSDCANARTCVLFAHRGTTPRRHQT